MKVALNGLGQFLSLGKLIIVIFIICLVTSFYVHDNNLHNFLTVATDSLGYYQYLPTWFCEGELLPDTYVVNLENGNPLSIFSFGVAILQMPFFLIGHIFAHLLDYPADGYSQPYTVAQIFSTAFYLCLSLFLLGKYLLSRFSKTVALLAVASIYLGTNLYYYSSFEMGMSHAYNFFVFAVLIFAFDRLLKTQKGYYLIIVAFIIGLLALVKPYNLIGLLWLIPFSKSGWVDLWEIFKKNKLALVISLMTLGLLLFSQMYYWHLVSGKYLLFSYGTKGEGFNWTSPELFNVLFSVQNGWFIYTPIMVFALIGIGIMIKNQRAEGIKIGIILLLIYYVISSWWAWWFGGAYGHRAFIEYYAFLVIPLAIFIEYALKAKRTIKIAVVSFIVIFSFVNIRMSHIYQSPWDGENWTWNSYNMVLNEVFFIK